MNNLITYSEICGVFEDPDHRMKLDDINRAGKLSREAFDFIKEIAGPMVAAAYENGLEDGEHE